MTAIPSSPVAAVMVASFYKFVTIADPRASGAKLLARARAAALRGTLLLAEEGLNASIAGPPHVCSASSTSCARCQVSKP